LVMSIHSTSTFQRLPLSPSSRIARDTEDFMTNGHFESCKTYTFHFPVDVPFPILNVFFTNFL